MCHFLISRWFNLPRLCCLLRTSFLHCLQTWHSANCWLVVCRCQLFSHTGRHTSRSGKRIIWNLERSKDLVEQPAHMHTMYLCGNRDTVTRVFKDVQIIPHITYLLQLVRLNGESWQKVFFNQSSKPQLSCLCFDWTISMSKLFLSSLCCHANCLCCKSVEH